MNDKLDNSALENAGDIIERFGGIRPMATKMGVPVTTVQGWKKRNVIPGNRRDDVVEAASANNIDISDLLKDGAANQNATRAPKQDFESTLTLAQKQEDQATLSRHQEAIAAGRVTAAQDDIIKTIRAAERRAVKTSTILSVLLVAGACALGAVLLWPTKEQVADNTRRVAILEGRMDDVSKQQGLLQRLIPENFAESFAKLQEQAAAIQGQIGSAALQAENLANNFLNADVGDIGARLSAIEQHIGSVTGGAAPDLGGLIARLKSMQQSVEGQTQLSNSVTELNQLIAGMQGRINDIDTVLADAQQQDDKALGQTLEGVSPTDLRAAAMLLGLAQFRSSLNRNAPFEEDLLLLKGLVGAEDTELNSAIDRLAPRAAEGVLTPSGLSDQFKGLAGDIVVSSLKGEDVSIQEKAKARFNEVMQVQKAGELVTGTDTQAKVARAQKMLDEGDIQGAISELQALEGPAADAAKPFMDEAMATLTAEKVREMMTGKVLSQLTSMKAGGGTPYMAAGLESLVNDLTGLVDTRKVISAPNSDIKIMPPQQKMIPGGLPGQ